MANIDVKFLCSFNFNDFIECSINYEHSDDDHILIKSTQEGVENFIMLDKSTAIKFAKTLRTEINKMQEVSNV